MMIKTYSLRRRLMMLIGIPIVVTGLLIGGLTSGFLYHEIGEVYDAQLVETAKLLLQLTVHELDEPDEHGLTLGPEIASLSHSYEKKMSFRVWKDEHMVTESARAGVFTARPAPPGFSLLDADSDGSFWRIFVFVDQASGITIEVAESNRVRTELIMQLMSSFFIPGLIFVPVLLLLVWFGTTKGFRPMILLASDVNMRNAEDLTPLSSNGMPEEIAPFTRAINRLFLRVNETLRREREFTDNAAHELRTPLAALKIQAQVLEKKFVQRNEDGEDWSNLMAIIDRATQMIGQLLSFSRLQNIHQPRSSVQFSKLIEEAMRELLPAALARNQVLEAVIKQDVHVDGYDGALHTLIGNLVDNAIKYTPDGGSVTVKLRQEGDDIILTVADTGPGIAAANRDQVFERFYRIDKNHGSGSGLGLSMVQWIANVHNARIELGDNEPHGLIISVIFPASPAEV